ncbi:DUF1016 N-terminal domain-containing protein [Arcticibacter svalbardensis]|uniref:DUF1016 N-terminal domain-containing protein n=1 Tax=Arcticibacter svalbardensis TaxID=1288027 RepID=UPI000A05E22E
MSLTNLKLFRQFYQTYPEIGQTLSDQLISEKDQVSYLSPKELLSHLNFSHFIELLKVENSLIRHFYAVEAVKINRIYYST